MDLATLKDGTQLYLPLERASQQAAKWFPGNDEGLEIPSAVIEHKRMNPRAVSADGQIQVRNTMYKIAKNMYNTTKATESKKKMCHIIRSEDMTDQPLLDGRTHKQMWGENKSDFRVSRHKRRT